jgi:HAD superfamily hydrolase (TIGR01509 family)
VVPDAIVFDLDGTVADTESIEYRSVARVWGDHGLEFTEDRWAHVIGQSWTPDEWLTDLVTEARERHTLELVVDELHRRQKDYKSVMLVELVPRPGILDLLRGARDAGVPLAIASNSTMEWVAARLEQLGLTDHFEVLCTVDVASRPKPDPAPYVEACARLGARPSHSVAFEDSTTGVASAVAAGLFTIGCPGPLTASHDLASADLLVETHEALSFDGLCAAFTAARGR